MQEFLRSIPDAWGPKLETRIGAATRTRTGPNQIVLKPPVTVALVMLTPQADREVALGSDRRAIGLAPVGSVEIIPADADFYARWRTDKENILFALEQDRFAQLAGDEFQNDSFELRPPRIGAIDREALNLARMARMELERGDEASAIGLDSIITLIAIHLLRRYSNFVDGSHRYHLGGLAPRVWRKTREFIESNIAENLSVAELAGLVGLSPSHFLRAFRETAGQTPHQYIIEQRLSLAERLVMTTDQPLSSVATRTGFASNSHMTSTMRRLRGVTPNQIRRGQC